MSAESSIAKVRYLLRKLVKSSSTVNFWPQLLPRVEQLINSRTNRMTGFAPNEITPADYSKIFSKLYPALDGRILPPLRPKFKINDTVRIIRESPDAHFQKGGKKRAESEVFHVTRILFHPSSILYRLSNKNGELLIGRYSSKDLIPVIEPSNKL